MKTFRNDFGQARVVPTLDYHLVEAGDTIGVPDEEWDHWVAGGWTPLEERPEPARAPASAAAETAQPAPVAPKTTKAAAAPAAEGSETA